MICVSMCRHGINKTIFENMCLSVICYGVINLCYFELNSFFNGGLLVGIILLVNLFRGDSKMFVKSVNLCLVLCEVFNMFFMFSKMNFAVIFSNEFVKNFVVLNLIVISVKIIVSKIKRLGYEKSCQFCMCFDKFISMYSM